MYIAALPLGCWVHRAGGVHLLLITYAPLAGALAPTLMLAADRLLRLPRTGAGLVLIAHEPLAGARRRHLMLATDRPLGAPCCRCPTPR